MKDQNQKGPGSKGTKMVEGGAVQFEQGTGKADPTKEGSTDLESKVVPATSLNPSLIEVYATNMLTLGEQLSTNHSAFRELSSGAIKYIGYFVKVSENSASSGFKKTMICPTVEELTDFLTSESMYGQDFLHTGIVESLKRNNACTIDAFRKYIPEVKELEQISSYIESKKNPYLYILSIPVACRPFFTGVIRSNPGFNDSRDLSASNLFNPITLELSLEYAKKIGAMPKISEYMGMLE